VGGGGGCIGVVEVVGGGALGWRLIRVGSQLYAPSPGLKSHSRCHGLNQDARQMMGRLRSLGKKRKCYGRGASGGLWGSGRGYLSKVTRTLRPAGGGDRNNAGKMREKHSWEEVVGGLCCKRAGRTDAWQNSLAMDLTLHKSNASSQIPFFSNGETQGTGGGFKRATGEGT